MTVAFSLGLVTFVALGFAPWVLPTWIVGLTTIALGNGLVVLGLIVLWRAGLVSFGQALYFALGAYSAAMILGSTPITDAIVLVIIAMLIGGAVSLLIGFLLARYREIFFAMLSLALSMILYGLLVKSAALGSTDGFNVGTFTLFGHPLEGEERAKGVYWLALAFAALATLAVSAYWRSVAGASAIPLRENEIRVEYLGVSANRLVHLKVIIAGILAAAGGAIVAMSVGHVDPDMAYWTTSGGFVFVAIMAGPASVIGAFIGSVVFELVRTEALAIFPNGWQLILGSVLLATIMFFPSGIGSLFTWRARPPAEPVGEPRRVEP
ncbi:MAG: branched-chain amino acid ABC transporter permease [Rhodomicrobiaceae bacterium]